MASKHIRTDVNLAYPNAEIAVMGPEGAVNILYRRELEEAGKDAQELRDEKVRDYREKFSNPYVAAARGYVGRGHQAELDPVPYCFAPCASCPPSVPRCRPRSMATCPSEALVRH